MLSLLGALILAGSVIGAAVIGHRSRLTNRIAGRYMLLLGLTGLVGLTLAIAGFDPTVVS
jgi:hypothetical protein